MAKTQAQNDLRPKYSSLANVKLRNDSRQSLRIIRADNNIFYIVDLELGEDSVRVELINSDLIEYITKNN